MITFGAKIPIAKCRIQNRETEKFENLLFTPMQEYAKELAHLLQNLKCNINLISQCAFHIINIEK